MYTQDRTPCLGHVYNGQDSGRVWAIGVGGRWNGVSQRLSQHGVSRRYLVEGKVLNLYRKSALRLCVL